MRKRGLLTLPVLLIAILALALGSVGTATAGGLTKSAVKKIAAKVVKKKATTLTVATATTATNATNLNGQPASSYLNQTFTFPIASGTATATKTFTFTGLPAGTYLMDFNIVGQMNTNTDYLRCFAKSAAAATDNRGLVYGVNNGTGFSAANSTVILQNVSSPSISCNVIGANTFSVYAGADFPSVATFTKIDSAGTGSTTAAAVPLPGSLHSSVQP